MVKLSYKCGSSVGNQNAPTHSIFLPKGQLLCQFESHRTTSYFRHLGKTSPSPGDNQTSSRSHDNPSSNFYRKVPLVGQQSISEPRTCNKLDEK